MAKSVELWRHTDADGDVLTSEGVRHAVQVGASLSDRYDLAISSGAQRATQTLACFLAGGGVRIPGGVVVDSRFRSDVEDRWKAAYQATGSGDIESFKAADPELVESESRMLSQALSEIFERLPEGGRAIVVGHSPMQEAAILGLTGEVVEPLSKGAGVVVTAEGGSYQLKPLN